MSSSEYSNQQPDRRSSPRHPPTSPMQVAKEKPVLPIADAEVLNVSAGGVALRTRVPIKRGERLSFSISPHTPPVLAQVLAVESIADGYFRIRCRCVLGNF